MTLVHKQFVLHSEFQKHCGHFRLLSLRLCCVCLRRGQLSLMLSLLSYLLSLCGCQLLFKSNLRFLHLLQCVRQRLQIHVFFFRTCSWRCSRACHPSLRRDVPVRSAMVYAPSQSLH